MTYELEETSFAAWLENYKAAWERRDPERAAALFTGDATYHEMPFDPPLQGTDAITTYWTNAVAGQQDVHFDFQILALAGREGLCHWQCAFTGVPGGQRIALDGIFRCRFADAALVEHFEEWWHVRVMPQSPQ